MTRRLLCPIWDRMKSPGIRLACISDTRPCLKACIPPGLMPSLLHSGVKTLRLISRLTSGVPSRDSNTRPDFRLAAIVVVRTAHAAKNVTAPLGFADGAQGCTTATIAGSYGIASDGMFSPTFSGQPQKIGEFIPIAFAGTFSLTDMEQLPAPPP